MQIETTKRPVTEIQASAVVLGVAEGAPLGPAAAAVDQLCDSAISRLLAAGEFQPQVGETALLYAPAGLPTGTIALTGLGPVADFSAGVAARSLGTAARLLAARPREHVAVYLDDWFAESLQATAVCGALVGCQGQDLYRAERSLHPFGRLSWSGDAQPAVREGQVLGDAVNLARRLVNEPPSLLDPEAFAEAAREVAEADDLRIDVWGPKRLRQERCEALLAVARGSTRPPQLVMLEYHGAADDVPPLALVGKGVTFDSGGLSLKPPDGMKGMKCDMAGAAAVLAAMQAIAQLQLPVNVIGLAGLVENMVSGDSFKVGDVLTSRNGKTIEVLNTDAEGRLVLADVLDVALERGAGRIIDLATLTGACMVALGSDVAGVMTNDQAWCDAVLAAADACGEPAWQLPMFCEYEELIRSEVADIKNIGEGRWGGAITAGKFLQAFVGDTPWVHFDIAGPAFLERPKPWIDAGGSGAFVRTLVEAVRNLAATAHPNDA